MKYFIGIAIALSIVPVAVAQGEHGFHNGKPSGQPYLSPEETVKRMTVPPEFEVKLFAGEPLVVNPIAFTIDEKGRVWVIECFEYPNRTPKGKKPRDRIVILEDTDGDGACDKRTVFAEGKDFPESFDLASGIEVGNGGVYVGAAPYLWFIENKNDKPGKYEILLRGFGSQDTHETLNTFQWGPDGWLYGLHGIFTHSNVKPLDGPETRMNAAVWRYHPKTKKFEVVAEGTSNPWGMDWRNSDGQFILCCCVIPHLFHIVPGGIYKRQAGSSANPYAFGYINEICDHTFHKESGWAHAGLISLDVPHMPERFRNSVIFGSIHGCSLKQNILKPNGSTYTASRGDDFLTSGDKNFRPINLRWGPNGDIYLIDWHDQNPCHQAAKDSWDFERGRVYRIQLKGQKPYKALDLTTNNLDDLSKFALQGNNPWVRRTALRRIREAMLLDPKRASPGMRPATELLTDPSPERALRAEYYAQALGLYLMPAINADVNSMSPINSSARIRNLSNQAEEKFQWDTIHNLAKDAASPELRRDLASFAARRPGTPTAAYVLRGLMLHDEDVTDPLLPLLIWHAYEPTLMISKDSIRNELAWYKTVPKAAFLRTHILPRTMRRLAASGDGENLTACLSFLKETNDNATQQAALEGLAAGLKDQNAKAPEAWKPLRDQLIALNDPKITAHVHAIAVAFRDPEAAERAYKDLHTDKLPAEARAVALKHVVQLKHPQALATTISLLRQGTDDVLRGEAARQLVAFDKPGIGQEVIDTWSLYSKAMQSDLVASLSSRKEWAKALLTALKEKKIDRAAVTDSTITRIQAFKDPALNKLIDESWGRSRATPAQLEGHIDAIRKELSAGPGSFAKGKASFEAHCAKCHKFDGRGSDVGPALDGAGRDIEYLLVNVLDPNRVIGAPYFVRQALTLDGAVIQGLLAEEDEKTITLKVENAALKKLAKADLDGPVKVLEKSLMPEGLTGGMKPQEFRDLVRYAMAHPYIQHATVNGKAAVGPVTGLIPVPEDLGKTVSVEASFTANDKLTTKLLVGAGNAFEAFLDGQPIGKGAGTERWVLPDHEKFDVTLSKGPHTLKVVIQTKWASPGVYLRFLDPDRKISYPE